MSNKQPIVRVSLEQLRGAQVVETAERKKEPRSTRRVGAAALVLATVLAGGSGAYVGHVRKQMNENATGAMSSSVQSESVGDVKPDAYKPPRMDCEPVADIAVNARTPIQWNIPNIPIAGVNDFPDLGRGTIQVESCVGNLIDNFDQKATERTGVQTYGLKPDDIQFVVRLSGDGADYQNGFPDYSAEEVATSMKNSSEGQSDQALMKAAEVLVTTIASFDDERRAYHLDALQSLISEEYGSELLETAFWNAQVSFNENLQKAGLNTNQVQLKPNATNGATFEFVESDETDTSFGTVPPFTYLKMVANTDAVFLKNEIKEE